MVKRIKEEKKKSLFYRLKQKVARIGNKDSGGEYQEDGYQYITDEMIAPFDKPLNTKAAVSIYRKYMLSIGYLEKSEMSDFVNSLKDEIRDHERFLKEEVKAAKEELVEAKMEAGPEIKRIKKLQSKSKDTDEKAEYLQDLEEAEEEIASAQRDLAVAVDELSRFKKDKRQFLINYINSEVQGPDWNQGQDG